ncbi:Hypothetical protein HVPorG_04668 [Roseomonas mucosa]|nr:Hypothetical protein HVPorG_04668 [Roseomonas mucosa]
MGGQAGFGQDQAEPGGGVVLQQHGKRQVHRDTAVPSPAAAAAHHGEFLRGTARHGDGQVQAESGAFHDWHEAFGRIAFGRGLPARQGFGAGRLAVADADDGLVAHRDLALQQAEPDRLRVLRQGRGGGKGPHGGANRPGRKGGGVVAAQHHAAGGAKGIGRGDAELVDPVAAGTILQDQEAGRLIRCQDGIQGFLRGKGVLQRGGRLAERAHRAARGPEHALVLGQNHDGCLRVLRPVAGIDHGPRKAFLPLIGSIWA